MARSNASKSSRTRTSAPRFLMDSLEQRMLCAVDVTIDAATRFQKIEGFGTAIEDWHAAPYTNDSWQNMAYQDLGSSIQRLAMTPAVAVGSDGNWQTPMTFGPDLQANIAQMNFGAASLDQTVAKAAVAKKLDQMKIITSIWTPPAWMKGEELNPYDGSHTGIYPVYNGTDSSGGSLIDTPDNMQQFGRYVATWVAGFQQASGVPIYAISIQNELANHTSYSSCVYTPTLFAHAVKAVGDAFAAWGITTKIQGPEHYSIGSTAEPWQGLQMDNYIDATRSDPTTYNYLSTYITHNYGNGTTPDGRSAQQWSDLWNGGNQTPHGLKLDGKELWQTEDSGEAASWSGAMLLAGKTMDALTFGNVSAYLYWQTSGADGDAPGTGNLTGGAGGLTKGDKYYAEQPFFRYVRPDSYRVSATPNDATGIEVSAFVQDAQHTLTSVLLNQTGTAQTINLHINNASVASFTTYIESQASGEGVAKPTVTVSNGVATITMPAYSIVTLQGATNVATTGSVTGTVYADNDNSGNFGAGDSYMAGARVFIDANQDGVYQATEASQITDSYGFYSFSGLSAGTYRVRVVPINGYSVTAPSAGYLTVSLAGGQTLASQSIGMRQASSAQFTGTVFADNDNSGNFGAGDSYVSGARVYIDANQDGVYQSTEASQITDSYGFYSFSGLSAGTYRVRVVPINGYSVTTPSTGYLNVTLAAGQSLASQSIGMRQASSAQFTGTIFADNDNNGSFGAGDTYVSGARVFIDANQDGIYQSTEASQITDNYGFYAFSGLAAGTYRVRVVPLNGYTVTTPAAGYLAVTLAAGQSLASQSLGMRQAAATAVISGTLYKDVDGNGTFGGSDTYVANTIVWIDSNANGIKDAGEPTATTDSWGFYQFSGLVAGTYRVRVSTISGWHVATPATGYYDVTLTAGQNVPSKSFGYQLG